MDIRIHDPGPNKGGFDGFEVFRKNIGGLNAHNSWQSVVNLTDEVREYEMEGIEPSSKYAVTVRGFVLPDSFSMMADPLIFETMEAGLFPFTLPLAYSYVISATHAHVIHFTYQQLRNAIRKLAALLTPFDVYTHLSYICADGSVPRNVQLQAIDPYTLRMAWDPPKQSYGVITGYTIEWIVDAVLQEYINLTSINFYDFTNVKPGQSIAVSVCAHNQPNTLVQLDYVGTRSDLLRITMPTLKGLFFFLCQSNPCHYHETTIVGGKIESSAWNNLNVVGRLHSDYEPICPFLEKTLSALLLMSLCPLCCRHAQTDLRGHLF
ncbi:unnamed protein product [Hydatigera taeniaeformis]|uniref:Fibronectin type-III domain-containing protein n=1 Tax=Hydatigena taeniaeformis TaxID=6205 RepID=A0A3P7FFH4_HYDTA|nr:unnamed protein product [Hydatigera taeniaeformis]